MSNLNKDYNQKLKLAIGSKSMRAILQVFEEAKKSDPEEFDATWLLNKCIINNSLDGVKEAIKLGGVIDLDIHGSLHSAIYFKSLEILKYLIEDQKVNIFEYQITKDKIVEIKTNDKNKLIVLAGADGNPQIIDYLISKGLVIEPHQHSFFFACSHGNIKNVNHLFFNYNCKINQFSKKHQETPLSWAASCERIEVINFLIENGADVALNENIVFKRAISSDNEEIISIFAKLGNIEQLKIMEEELAEDKEVFKKIVNYYLMEKNLNNKETKLIKNKI